MKTTLKTNTGFLHNAPKENRTKEGSPNFFGSMDVNGTTYQIGGWLKTGEKHDSVYISLNFDKQDTEQDDRAKLREENLKAYKVAKKLKENKGKFIMIEQTGAIHKTGEDKKEDFFGSVLLEGEKVYLKGFIIETTSKKTGEVKNVVRLVVSDGMKPKEERTKMVDSFLN